MQLTPPSRTEVGVAGPALRRRRRVLVDVAIAAMLLVGSGIWATRFWNAWMAQGGEPVFYQTYFEPAVMIACGHGFVVSESGPTKALDDFLSRRRDTLACSDLPADLKLSTRNLYQGAWIYLETCVGWAWRLLGISWSRMGPLFGLLFGIVIAVAYGVFRVSMGPALAAVCAFGLATSPTHLLNLPHLRDYAKAPFTLALVLILALMVTRPVRRASLLALAAAYGFVLGIGYGFRTDFLIDVPILIVVVLLLLDGGIGRHLALKAGALLVFAAVFLSVGWPALTAVYRGGGCQWHAALLGLQAPFDQPLRIVPAPYDFGYAYADGYVVRQVQGYTSRVHPDALPPTYCFHDYDVQSGEYVRRIVQAFPADFLTRAYASVLQVVELPWRASSPPAQDWAPRLYRMRASVLGASGHAGFWFIGAALLIVTAISRRLGLFLFLFVVYFGGYPALQFHERHFFHLEFMGWWAMGFLAQRATAAAWSFRTGEAAQLHRQHAASAALSVAVALAVTAATLGAARWYQTREAKRLLQSYVAAPKINLDHPGDRLPDATRSGWPRFVEVDLNEASCGPAASVVFRYDTAPADGDFSRIVRPPPSAPGSGLTRIFLPVFEQYAGLDLRNTGPGCLVAAYQLSDLRPFPILLGATLSPGWDTRPLYQRLASWGRE